MQHNPPAKLNLQPSGASCWTVCTAQPAYVQANAHLIPDDLDTKWSVEGDQAHEVSEAMLRGRAVPGYATPEMRRHGAAYAEFCRSKQDPFEGRMYIEQRVPLWYMPERSGRVDCYIINPGGVHVIDLKYGAGIRVEAVGNKQAAIYALSVIIKLEKEYGEKLLSMDTMVHIHIFQPRNGGTSSWSLNLGDLHEWAFDRISIPAEAVLNNTNVCFAPSDDTCIFCPAKGFCTARTEFLLTGLPEVQEAISSAQLEVLPPKPLGATLSKEQLAYIKTHGGAIKAWIDSVIEYMDQLAASGRVPAGFKLVYGRGQRYWADEERVEKLLRTKLTADEVMPCKLISPSKAEELLEGHELSTRFKGLFDSLIAKKQGNLILVPDSDPRPHYGASAVSDFPDAVPDDCPV